MGPRHTLNLLPVLSGVAVDEGLGRSQFHTAHGVQLAIHDWALPTLTPAHNAIITSVSDRDTEVMCDNNTVLLKYY